MYCATLVLITEQWIIRPNALVMLTISMMEAHMNAKAVIQLAKLAMGSITINALAVNLPIIENSRLLIYVDAYRVIMIIQQLYVINAIIHGFIFFYYFF